MCNRFLRYLEEQFFCCLGRVNEDTSSEENSESSDDESSNKEDSSSNEKESYQNESDDESQGEDLEESTGSQETRSSENCSLKVIGSTSSIAYAKEKSQTSKRPTAVSKEKHVTISREVQMKKTKKQSINDKLQIGHKATTHSKEKEKKKETIQEGNLRPRENKKEEGVADQKQKNSAGGKLATENRNSKEEKHSKKVDKKPEQMVQKNRLNESDKPKLSTSKKIAKDRPSLTTKPLSKKFPPKSVKKQGSSIRVPKRR